MDADLPNLLQRAAEVACDGDPQTEDLYWECVGDLHRRTDAEIFDQCEAWSLSSVAALRTLAADLLAQLGCLHQPYPFREQTLPIFLRLLKDPDDGVLSSALCGLGHHGPEVAIREMVGFKDHTNPDARYSLASALGGDPSEDAVAAQIQLSRDTTVCVRDWATFGLGSLGEVDTPAIRDALLERAHDPDCDTRGEAFLGLSNRADLRAVPFLKAILESESVSKNEVEAARNYALPELVEALQKLMGRWDLDDELLAEAIAMCSAQAG